MAGRRTSGAPVGTYTAPPKSAPITIARAVDEGVLIARSTVTMETKNHLIVRAIRDDAAYDPAELERFARTALGHLAAEQNESAERLARLAKRASGDFGRPQHEHDYHSQDFRTLTKRAQIAEALAAELARIAGDPAVVAELLENARVAAWAELGSVITGRLTDAVIETDRFYDADRDARLRALVDIDIAELLRRR